MIKELIFMANHLDEIGFHAEADVLDGLIKSAKTIFDVRFIGGFEEKHLNPNSSFSHFEGSQEELENLIIDNLDQKIPSPDKARAFLVPLPAERFKSGIVSLDDDSKLVGSFEHHMGDPDRERRKGWRAITNEEKQTADYAWAAISESFSSITGRDLITVFTIIAGVMGESKEDEDNFIEPMNPQAMMYNRYWGESDPRTPEEFDKALKKSFLFWRDKAIYQRG